MLELSLSELAQSLGVACESGDVVVTGLAIDSRAVKPGDLFVAIDGEHVDGHDFIDKALDNGAAAIACTRPINVVAPHIKAADSYQVCAIYGRLIRERFHGSVIGITGSRCEAPFATSVKGSPSPVTVTTAAVTLNALNRPWSAVLISALPNGE